MKSLDQIRESPVNVVLVEPEIPSNTGNIIRLCANTGAKLHLIGPLGFNLDNSKMLRAGLDYHELCTFFFHDSWETFMIKERPSRGISYAITTKGEVSFFEEPIPKKSWLFFGSETRGLSGHQQNFFPNKQRLKIPMQLNSRSLNLGNAVAVCVYEVWRQFYI